MTPRFTTLSLFALLVAGLGAACDAAVPQVRGRDLVIPDRQPGRITQALEAPSTANTDGGSGSDEQVYCLDGEQTLNEQNPDGSFVSEFTCAPGGGIASIRNEGQGDELGDGSYDQITTLENGDVSVWHFTFDTSEDFLTTTYSGVSDDGAESYVGVYTYLDALQSDVHEEWSLAEGLYVIDGVMSNDGLEFEGEQSFDDPSTDASPDWSLVLGTSADGSFVQDVHAVGDGFVSDYTYAVTSAGEVEYDFVTDDLSTDASPDFSGSYRYEADLSGEGSYSQLLDDGSVLVVSDIIHADGSVVESWVFDDIATEQAVDQEGEIAWALDGSGEGTVTSHVVGGEDQTCDIHIAADGEQTIDNCG